jgi:hypothetical protein
MVPRLLILICGYLLVAVSAIPAAANDSVAVGVNVVNPQRLNSAAREAVLDRCKLWACA